VPLTVCGSLPRPVVRSLTALTRDSGAQPVT
jgi:hypothetical protein